MRHSTGKPTTAEQARFDTMKERGECMACLLFGCQPDYPQHVEIHHLLSGGRRRGHRYSIALCTWHHRAVVPFAFGLQEARDTLGPSLAEGSKPFRARFGTDDELLAMQDGRIGWTGLEAA